MAGFSEPEDAYAADGEGSASHFKRQRNSIRNRDPGPHLASRLRQRPPTKHDAASDVPRSSPGSHLQKTQQQQQQQQYHYHHQQKHFQHYYQLPQQQQQQRQQLPVPVRHRSHEDFRSQHIAATTTTTNPSSRSYLLDDDDEDDEEEEEEEQDEYDNDLPPQLPAPSPLSPLSPPRWAIGGGGGGSSSSSFLFDAIPTPTSPSSYSGTAVPTSPIISYKNSSRVVSGSSTTTTTTTTSSRFPGLSSHPPYIPDPLTPELSNPSTPQLPLGAEDRHEVLLPTGLATPTSITSPGLNYRPDSRDTNSGNMLVENFSRPRKPSIRQSPLDFPASRLRQPEPVQLDQTLPSSSSPWPRDRARGLSLSSNKSSSTYASSLPHRPSNDHLRGNTRVHGNATAAAASLTSTPSASSGGMISPGLSRPPLAYSRTDSSTGNSLAASGHHHHHHHPAHARDVLPWMVDEELRSSYRSQLTASTAQGTLFTPSGTERSSVLTKTSSRTSASLYPGAGLMADEGLSVEDVMGMYEKGFYSTGAEDNDADLHNDEDDDDDEVDDSRPVTSRSDLSKIGSRILEAMSDPLPLPSQPFAIPNGESPHVVRDSGAFFRNSGLPLSLPKDVGLGLATENMKARKAAAAAAGQQDAQTATKRDSAKMLDNDDRLPPPMMMRRQPSAANSIRTVSSTTQPNPLGSHAVYHRDDSLDNDNDSRSSPQPQLQSQSPLPPPPPPPPPRSNPSPAAAAAAVEEDDPTARDRYGFRKHNQYISRDQYDGWNTTYSEYLARRKKKWVAYLKDAGLPTEQPTQFPAPGPKTKRFIRKGIPPEWRGAAWFHYAQGPAILAKHPGEYEALVQRAGRGDAKEIDAEAIERDLHRTFPDNIRFKFAGGQPGSGGGGGGGVTDEGASDDTKTDEPEIVSSLRRVLLAFSIYNPRIGYCQSLNFLAGLLLLFVDTEEQCFWLLNVITRLYLPGTHETSLEGSKVDLGVLMAALKDAMPSVWAKVGGDLDDAAGTGAGGPPSSSHTSHGGGGGTLGRRNRRAKTVAPPTLGAGAADRLPPITLCMTAWFMSCFIGTLPIETTLRVWDVFFYEGSKTLFRVALGIFKMGETEIRAVTDPMEMFGVVQAIPRRLVDCNAVMEATFRRRNGFGHISQESIEEKRRERRDALKEARRAVAAATAATTGTTTPIGGGGAGGITAVAYGEVTSDVEGAMPYYPEVRRKGTLFGRRRERRGAAEVV